MNIKERDEFIKRPAIDLLNRQKKKRIDTTLRWKNEGDTAAIEPMSIVARRKNEDAELRNACIKAIGSFDCPEAITVLQSLVTDDTTTIGAIQALASFNSRAAVCALIGAWAQATPAQTESVCQALRQLGVAQTIDPLVNALLDPSPQVRDQSCKMLASTPEAVMPLVTALKNQTLRAAAQETLTLISSTAVEPLVAVLASDDALYAEAAGQTLLKIGAPAVRPLLASCAAKPDNLTWLALMKPAVAIVFQNVGADDLPLLKGWFSGGDIDFRNIAALSLPRLGQLARDFFLSIVAKAGDEYIHLMNPGAAQNDKQLVLALIRVLGQPDEYLRRAAASALLCIDNPLANALKPLISRWQIAPQMITVAPDITSDAHSLVNAISAAKPGAMIQLETGDYHLNQPLILNKSIALISTAAAAARITGVAEGIQTPLDGDDPFSLIGLSLVDCSVLAAHGTAAFYQCRHEGNSGLTLSGTVRATVTDCDFVEHPGDIIVVKDNATVDLNNNLFRGEGVCISLLDKVSGTVRQNQFFRGRIGIKLALESNITLEDNTCANDVGAALLYTSVDIDKAQAAFDKVKTPPSWDVKYGQYVITYYHEAIVKARTAGADKVAGIRHQLINAVGEIIENYTAYFEQHTEAEWMHAPVWFIDQLQPDVTEQPEEREHVRTWGAQCWYKLIVYYESKLEQDPRQAESVLKPYLNAVERAMSFMDADDPMRTAIDLDAAVSQISVGENYALLGRDSVVLSRELEVVMNRHDIEHENYVRQGITHLRAGMERLDKYKGDESYAETEASGKQIYVKAYLILYLLNTAHAKPSKCYQILEEAVKVVTDDADLWAMLGHAYGQYDDEIVDEYNKRDLGNTLNGIDRTITRAKRADLEKKIYTCAQNARKLDPQKY